MYSVQVHEQTFEASTPEKVFDMVMEWCLKHKVIWEDFEIVRTH